MVDLKPGQLVRSLAGRDKGKHYLVLRLLDSHYVLVADGRTRPVDKPKKKNSAHLQHYERGALTEDQFKPENITDSEIIRFLKELVPVTGAPDEEV